jgi:hypothetical protein
MGTSEDPVARFSERLLAEWLPDYTVRHTLGVDGLPADQQQPVGFLRGQHAAGQTRFESTLAERKQVMTTLCGERP